MTLPFGYSLNADLVIVKGIRIKRKSKPSDNIKFLLMKASIITIKEKDALEGLESLSCMNFNQNDEIRDAHSISDFKNLLVNAKRQVMKLENYNYKANSRLTGIKHKFIHIYVKIFSR